MRMRLSSLSHKAGACNTCRALLPKTPSPRRPQLRVIFVAREPTGTPSTQTRTLTQSHVRALVACPRPSIARLSTNSVVRMDCRGIKGRQNPVPEQTATTAPLLAQDFVRQQVSKQQRSNFHSTSITPVLQHTMVSQSVNKTNLHPSGVA